MAEEFQLCTALWKELYFMKNMKKSGQNYLDRVEKL